MKAIILSFFLSVSLNYVLSDNSDVAENKLRVALLKNETEAQLQNTIQQNFAFADPLVQKRSDAYNASGLTILSDYTDDQIVFWNAALSNFETALSSETYPTERLAMLRTMAATTEGMRWDETERAKDPTITPANINITSCSIWNSLDLTAKLNVNLAKLNVLLNLASLQQGFEGDIFWAQFYEKLAAFYSNEYTSSMDKALALSGVDKCKNLIALNNELSRLLYVMTTSAKA